VLSVFYERLSERRQTGHLWEGCSKISEQQWWMSGHRQWQGVTGRHWDDQKSKNGVDLLSACQQRIVVYQRGTEVQYRADIGKQWPPAWYSIRSGDQSQRKLASVCNMIRVTKIGDRPSCSVENGLKTVDQAG